MTALKSHPENPTDKVPDEKGAHKLKRPTVQADFAPPQDRILNSSGQTVVAESLPASTDVGVDEVDAYGTSQYITVALGEKWFKLDREAALSLIGTLRSLAVNLV